MIHSKIDKLVPYIGEGFLEYPLWEEGVYVPTIKIWNIVKPNSIEYVSKTINKFKDKYKESYDIYTGPEDINNVVNPIIYSSCAYDILICPVINDTEDMGYEFNNKDWSIEEMLDILYELTVELDKIEYSTEILRQRHMVLSRELNKLIK